jgi:hypothetical protein
VFVSQRLTLVRDIGRESLSRLMLADVTPETVKGTHYGAYEYEYTDHHVRHRETRAGAHQDNSRGFRAGEFLVGTGKRLLHVTEGDYVLHVREVPRGDLVVTLHTRFREHDSHYPLESELLAELHPALLNVFGEALARYVS